MVGKGDGDEIFGGALVALAREERISTLRSPWVCSVAATTGKALEAALWHASSARCLATLGGHTGFTVAVDGAVPVTEGGGLAQLLPLTDDPCLLYSSEPPAGA